MIDSSARNGPLTEYQDDYELTRGEENRRGDETAQTSNGPGYMTYKELK